MNFLNNDLNIALEAARAAGERGHKVILTEAAAQIGGQYRLAGLQPRRSQILDLLTWYETQLTKLGVEVKLNTYVEAEDKTAASYDGHCTNEE